jgi:CHAT domain-containing protein
MITKNDLQVQRIEKDANYEKIITRMRNGILYKSDKIYAESAYQLYKILFPFKIPDAIQKLVVIQEGAMSRVPFEALVTQLPSAELIAGKNYSNYPFLLKQYDISYAFSAHLFYTTAANAFKPTPDTRDFIGVAPVFADERQEGVVLTSEAVRKQLQQMAADSTTRGTLINGEKVAPLPATEEEVKAIFDYFKAHGLGAEARTHGQAHEQFIKEGGLRNTRFIHIATHGFVNEENPELSGIMLYQDKSSPQDCMLYSGEIYNLDLNAELITLSACETGLGKVSKGEGVLGLSRALIYAGTRNLMVSLWKVADHSTSELMISFYANMLQNKGFLGKSLRSSKIALIEKFPQYGQPYYWSPFVLIGE